MLPTGFGTASREILRRLALTGRYDITCLGLQCEDMPRNEEEFPYKIVPPGNDRFGKGNLTRLLAGQHYDLIITFGDIWHYHWVQDLPSRKDFRWLFYVPVDGDPIPKFCLPACEAVDSLIVCSDYGQRTLQAALPHVDVGMIYHGVDTHVFHPSRDRAQLRARSGLEEGFVVGFVGRNQHRKQIPRLMEAFVIFREMVGDVQNKRPFLYLHTCVEDIGWDVVELRTRYGLSDCAEFTSGITPRHGVSSAQLADIYNLFDVFVLPSMAEGFGLPIIEALACGVPVIATNYSACTELVMGRGELIKPLTFLVEDYTSSRRAVIDVDDLASKLFALWQDDERRKKYGAAGKDFAEQLDWDILVPQWEQAIHRVLSN